MPFPEFSALRSKRVSLRIAFASICLALLLIWSVHALHSLEARLTIYQSPNSNQPPCRSLPGANDTLIVLKTGSTEIKDRFPIHTSTTLRCFPHYLIFSDFEEDYLGERIFDALESVSPDIVANNPDFELYRRLRQGGRAVLDADELSGSDAKIASPSGETENPGWKLDKWKFLPMLNRTLHEYPHMNWYVFVEADTFVLWSMLQRYLAVKDHTQSLLAGYLIMLGSEPFAHGGTGLIVSQPALKAVVEYYIAHKADVEARTDENWAGDYILGKTFEAAGVPLTNVKPILQGNHPGVILYGRPDGLKVPHEPTSQPQVWCSPTVSYHHMSPEAIESLWHFEQRWLESKVPDVQILRHKHVFKHYIMPQMATSRQDWDNLSDSDVEDNVNSLEECRAACEARSDCTQYSYSGHDGRCRNRINPRLGVARQGFTSDWIMDRVTRFEQDMVSCGDVESWIPEPW